MSTGTLKERASEGRAARKKVARSSHGDWVPPADRRDPVALLEEQNRSRLPFLVPIRHARMRVSPFTFYRGTARIMAADLAATPTSGLTVQLGGDAHCSNFGAYASPERQLVFDANDFDETLRGPWEWDLKRLAVSFTVAGQSLGFSKEVTRVATARCAESYRLAMASFAPMGFLDLWYVHMTVDRLSEVGGLDLQAVAGRIDRFVRRARSKTSLQALRKLTVEEGGRYRIRSDPPVLFPLSELPEEFDPRGLEGVVRDALERYEETLADDRRWLLGRYSVVDVGLKVVGVGSVGTRCLIVLFQGRDSQDPLFLQAKEATASVLEEFLEPSPYDNHGRRVVEGQRMIQAESDVFLGWTRGREGRDFYVRQLRDWKGSVEIEKATPEQLEFYARLCGYTLARGHARSGDAVAIQAYAGKSDTFDRAVVAFAEKYARQNLEDYEAFSQAIADGRLEVADAQ